MDRTTHKGCSLSFTVLMNSFLKEHFFECFSLPGSGDVKTSLQKTTLPHDVIDTAWCEFLMKIVSTN